METLVIYLSSAAGVCLTFLLKRLTAVNTVRASAITILVACAVQWFLLHFFPDLTFLNMISYCACGGSFCGMSSSKIIRNIYLAAFCGLIYGLIFTQLIIVFDGLGGSLGTGACISVMACYGVMLLVDMIRSVGSFCFKG